MDAFAHVPGQLVADDLIGFDSPSLGPLLVLVGWDVADHERTHAYVFDPHTGAELGSFAVHDFTGEPDRTPVHVYESSTGPVLVVAPEGEPVRQYSLPGGYPQHREFTPEGRTHAVRSVGGELIIADATGWVRRFEAATGAPAGKPVRYGPSRWLRGPKNDQLRPPARRMAVDATAPDPTVMVTDRIGDLWRVDLGAGKAKKVRFARERFQLNIEHVLPDPLGRPFTVVIGYNRIDDFVAFSDAESGDPIYTPERFEDRLDSIAVAAVDDIPVLFTSLFGRLYSTLPGTGAPPELLYGDDSDEFMEDLDVCVCPAGARTAVFAFDGTSIFRFDAAEGTPWPLE